MKQNDQQDASADIPSAASRLQGRGWCNEKDAHEIMRFFFSVFDSTALCLAGSRPNHAFHSDGNSAALHCHR